MNNFLKYLNLIIGVFAVVDGVMIPVNDIVQAGKIVCGDALALSILIGGLVLLGATHFIDKSNRNNKYLYFFSILVLSYLVMIATSYVIQSFYGMSGQPGCSLFVG